MFILKVYNLYSDCNLHNYPGVGYHIKSLKGLFNWRWAFLELYQNKTVPNYVKYEYQSYYSQTHFVRIVGESIFILYFFLSFITQTF